MRQEFFQEVLSLTEDFDGTWEKVVAILIKASEKTCGPEAEKENHGGRMTQWSRVSRKESDIQGMAAHSSSHRQTHI